MLHQDKPRENSWGLQLVRNREDIKLALGEIHIYILYSMQYLGIKTSSYLKMPFSLLGPEKYNTSKPKNSW